MDRATQAGAQLPSWHDAPFKRSGAAIVLGLALATRLLPFFSLLRQHKATWIFGRGLETGFVAHALLNGQGFASPFGGDTGPTALISPGYTLLVAAVFRLFGDASAASAIVILLTQIALGVLTVWLIMRLTARLAGGRAALFAGAYFALWPPLLWVPTIFWDTSLTLCLMPALVLLALRLRERPTMRLWLALGALSGFAVLVNLALPPTVLAVFAWLLWTTKRTRRGLPLAGALALLIYAPWPIRNAHAFHAFIPLRTTVGLELWMGNREGAKGFVDESIFPLYNHSELTRYRQLGEIAYMQEKSAFAMAHISQYPGTFVALSARRFLRFWFGAGTQNGSALYNFRSDVHHGVRPARAGTALPRGQTLHSFALRSASSALSATVLHYPRGVPLPSGARPAADRPLRLPARRQGRFPGLDGVAGDN